jgi:uncharacterized membrane protein YeaQ/YmgE (transglycosylase-associated protein family)
MKIHIIFQILAVALAGAAAYFLYTGHRDGAFVSAVLGCVAFLLSLRFQVKARNATREAERGMRKSRVNKS